jgi:hypothetical protein
MLPQALYSLHQGGGSSTKGEGACTKEEGAAHTASRCMDRVVSPRGSPSHSDTCVHHP